MSDPKLWLRYTVRSTTDKFYPSQQKPIDLLAGVYRLPPIGEYYRSILLELESKTGPIQAEPPMKGLRQISSCGYRLEITQDGSGMTGLRRVDLKFRVNDVIYPLQIIIPLHPEHLDLEQFHAHGLRDIEHWLFFELASSVKLDIGYMDRFTQALRSHQAILNLINERISEIEKILQHIAIAPKKQIRKEYYQSTRIFQRQDPVTLRWSERNPDNLHTLAFRQVPSYDVYENQFIRFFLNQLKNRLAFLQRIADRTIANKEQEILKDKSWNKNHRNPLEPSELERQKSEAIKLKDDCQASQRRLYQLDHLDFLQQVKFDPGQFGLSYSLALTQDFNYSRVFAFYRELGTDEGIKRLDLATNFCDGLTSLGMKANHKIYEYWTFFALRNELKNLHFRLKDEDEILEMINSDIFNPGLKPGGSITLVGDKEIYGDMKIQLYYEREFKSRTGSARPDVTMEIWQQKSSVRYIFDAKYKTYTDAEGKNSKDWFWRQDFEQISNKYQDPRYGGRIAQSQGAFLLHLNTQDDWFENYGAFVQMDQKARWQPKEHRFGFIPLVPDQPVALRKLLAMILLVILKKEVNICWACGSIDIQKGKYSSQHGTEKDNKRKCHDCGNVWWVQHCGCGFFPLYKGDFSFQVQHKKLQDGSSCTGYVCPKCGRCICGATKDQIFNA